MRRLITVLCGCIKLILQQIDTECARFCRFTKNHTNAETG